MRTPARTSPPRQLPGRARGFTLIEVMIVVVIVAALMAIALPGYESSMQKGRRNDARGALLDVAGRQEQYMLDRNTYTTNLENLGFGDAPWASPEGWYQLSAIACGGDPANIDRCYILTATPTAGSPQADDGRCTSFTLYSDGNRRATGTQQDECW